MIVRSMLDNPDQPFDYFNDYKDTICWLSRQLLTGTDQEIDQAVDAIRLLRRGHAEWLSKWNKTSG